jgi:valyl-tRNA synthetase
VKPNFGELIDPNVYNKTIDFFEKLLQLLHPFMPFVTEEIYHLLREHEDDICVSQIQNSKLKIDKKILDWGFHIQKVSTGVQYLMNRNNIKSKDKISMLVQSENIELHKSTKALLEKRLITKAVEYKNSLQIDNLIKQGYIVGQIGDDIFAILPEKEVDTSALKIDLKKDLQYQKNFLQSVQKKLNNERFVQNAKPEVVELERKKQADAEARIKTLEESLQNLN